MIDRTSRSNDCVPGEDWCLSSDRVGPCIVLRNCHRTEAQQKSIEAVDLDSDSRRYAKQVRAVDTTGNLCERRRRPRTSEEVDDRVVLLITHARRLPRRSVGDHVAGGRRRPAFGPGRPSPSARLSPLRLRGERLNGHAVLHGRRRWAVGPTGLQALDAERERRIDGAGPMPIRLGRDLALGFSEWLARQARAQAQSTASHSGDNERATGLVRVGTAVEAALKRPPSLG